MSNSTEGLKQGSYHAFILPSRMSVHSSTPPNIDSTMKMWPENRWSNVNILYLSCSTCTGRVSAPNVGSCVHWEIAAEWKFFHIPHIQKVVHLCVPSCDVPYLLFMYQAHKKKKIHSMIT